MVALLFVVGTLVVVVMVELGGSDKFVKLFLIVVVEVIFTSVKGFVVLVVLDLSIYVQKTKQKIRKNKIK